MVIRQFEIAGIIGRSVETVRRDRKKPGFPTAIMVAGSRCVGFLLKEVAAFYGVSEEILRSMLARLRAGRSRR